MILQHQQNCPQQQSNGKSPSKIYSNSDKSNKIASHLTIQQQNQNNKQKAKSRLHKQKRSPGYLQEKKYRSLSKQSKKVKSLQEEYRQLQEQVRQIKELVQLQVELIDYSTQQINERQTVEGDIILNNKEILASQQTPSLSIVHLQSCLRELFSYQQTIETANSNYLLLSQVNKEQQSQSLFHIHNLEQRIRQLRFLLNGKEDLLAYEAATFEGTDNLQQQLHHDVRKIFIDYHLPKKQSLANKNSMQTEFNFVHKVVAEMTSLTKTVKHLQNQLKSSLSYQNRTENQENQFVIRKNPIVESNQNKLNQFQSNFKTPTKTTRYRQKDPVKFFTECQNTLISAQTARNPQRKVLTNPTTPNKNQNQLTLLPLSTQNYKHSLIYRVGKLHAVQQQRSKNLHQIYQKLQKQLSAQFDVKKKLIKEYELKRDVYAYKKRLLNEKNGMGPMQNLKSIFTQNICTQNILADLEEKSSQNQTQELVNKIQQNSQKRSLSSNKGMKEIEDKFQLDVSQTSNFQNEELQQPIPSNEKTAPSQKQLTIMELSQSSISRTPRPEIQSPTKSHESKLIFNEITNSRHQPIKKIQNPFLKLKDRDPKRKHFSHQEADYAAKDKKSFRQKRAYEDTDKENFKKKKNLDQKEDLLLPVQNQMQDHGLEGVQVFQNECKQKKPEDLEIKKEVNRKQSKQVLRRRISKVRKTKQHNTLQYNKV